MTSIASREILAMQQVVAEFMSEGESLPTRVARLLRIEDLPRPALRMGAQHAVESVDRHFLYRLDRVRLLTRHLESPGFDVDRKARIAEHGSNDL